jgi:hypothetical protein
VTAAPLVEVYTAAGRARHAAEWHGQAVPLRPLCRTGITEATVWYLTADAAVPERIDQAYPLRCGGCQAWLRVQGRTWPARGRPA